MQEMIGFNQVSNGLSLRGVGVDSLATEALTLFKCQYLHPFYWTYFDKFLLTILNISPILNIEQLFGYRLSWKG